MLKLVQTEYGHFELALIGTTENAGAAIAKTVLHAVLNTDQIAPADRVDDGEDRRGWWYDDTTGTGLWYVRRQALTDAARRETIRMIREALLATEGMTDIVVTDISSQRNVSLMVIDIRGKYDGVEFHTEFIEGLIPDKAVPGAFNVLWNVIWIN